MDSNYRIDDLGDGVVIYSNPNSYCFTSDSVRLSNLIKGGAKHRMVDLCSGAGVIPLLVAKKTTIAQIVGVELQEELALLATKSIEHNNYADRITVLCRNLIGVEQELGVGQWDIVTCNPPYYKQNSGEMRLTPSIAMARHELSCTLNDIVKTAAKLLKFGGKLIMVHKCERMAEVLSTLDKYKLVPKELITYQPTVDKLCDTFTVVAKLGANHGMTVQNQVVTDSDL